MLILAALLHDWVGAGASLLCASHCPGCSSREWCCQPEHCHSHCPHPWRWRLLGCSISLSSCVGSRSHESRLWGSQAPSLALLLALWDLFGKAVPLYAPWYPAAGRCRVTGHTGEGLCADVQGWDLQHVGHLQRVWGQPRASLVQLSPECPLGSVCLWSSVWESSWRMLWGLVGSGASSLLEQTGFLRKPSCTVTCWDQLSSRVGREWFGRQLEWKVLVGV